MSSLDRLALVCKIMLDQRILDLRSENEALRLKLFWKDHGKNKLRDRMAQANQMGPNCMCIACAVSGRMDEEAETVHSSCTFKEWFEGLLSKCGLTCITGVDMVPVGPHMSCDCGNYVYDVNSHFHHLTNDDWVAWMYGAKLWKAQSVSDPELQKLKKLFEILDPATDDSDA